MSCEQWREKLTDYIEGSLPDDQRHQMAAHLQQCANCAQELAAFRRTVAALRELPLVPAPSDLPARIRQALPTQQRVFGYRISWQALGAVGTAACLLVAFWVVLSSQRPPGITARRELALAPPTTPQPAEAPAQATEGLALEEAPAAPPPSETERLAEVIVARVKPRTKRSTDRPAELLPPPTLETAEGAATPTRAAGLVADAAAPSPGPFEAEEVTVPETAPSESAEAMRALAAPGAASPAGAGAYGGARVAFGPDDSAPAAEEPAAAVKVTVTPPPPRERVVGQEAQVKVVIEPEVDVARAVVRVKPEETLRVTAPEGIAFRGPLKADEQNTLKFGIIAADPGTQRLIVELSSEVPGIATSLPVTIPGFHSPAPDTDGEPAEANSDAEHSSD